MAARKTLGLLFTYDTAWIGGSYYILNLIHALNSLNDSLKPNIVILSFEKKDYDVALQTGYPYLSFKNLFIQQGILPRLINKILRPFTKDNLINGHFSNNEFDLVFPFKEIESLKKITKKAYWIPDFQEHHLPAFFSADEKEKRFKAAEYISLQKDIVIFSSKDSEKDFKRFYPGHTSKTRVINFAVTHPSIQNISPDEIRVKYSLPEKYFISPNQFWAHKNHSVIIEAINILNQKGINNIVVAFTGKEDDYRNPQYAHDLKQLVKKYELQGQIRFLGFIERTDQLVLMKKSLAVIQPSLFEGWSTVVEDAKALNQFVIASAINVHKEQISENGIFFDPKNPNELALLLEKYNVSAPEKSKVDYKVKVSDFGNAFVELLQ